MLCSWSISHRPLPLAGDSLSLSSPGGWTSDHGPSFDTLSRCDPSSYNNDKW